MGSTRTKSCHINSILFLLFQFSPQRNPVNTNDFSGLCLVAVTASQDREDIFTFVFFKAPVWSASLNAWQVEGLVTPQSSVLAFIVFAKITNLFLIALGAIAMGEPGI